MSHFTKISAVIKDLEALTAAANKMGFEVQRDAKCRYYYGAEKKDFVIKLPGQYDIAATVTDGTYQLEADFYNGYVSRYVGNNGDKLMQQYTVEKAKIEAFQRGLSVTEEEKGNTIILTLTDQDTGGQIVIECYPGGNSQVKTQGFQGQGCMKFRELEEALGHTDTITPTDEMYLPETDTAVEVVGNTY